MSFAQFNPVNALRRAKDFELAGDKDKALEHLYEVLTSRKMGRQWQPAHEQMMIKFIDLCVEFRESRKCKEGLYFYRNLSSQQNSQSLEKVVSYLVELSMKKAAEARARTESISIVQLDNLEDLESEEQSPETLLMAGVTSEGSRDRAEREILVPWVRHMWDTYRNVMETLRNNLNLENLYHIVVVRAMGFCKQYNRGAEFKKLCQTLRNHWQATKSNAEQNGRDLGEPAIEKAMATRFIQLEHCAEMNLWSEGFRTIGDIREMMDDTKVVPKPQMMASYYEKLARIFWVSENPLFHAYSWYRFVALSLAKNQSLTEDDRRNLATAVLLSALSIPIYSSGPAGSGASYNTSMAVDPLGMDADRKKKNDLASLLRTPPVQQAAMALPTREALLNELASKRILNMVRPEAAALYKLLEGDFSPLTIVQRAQPLLAWIESQKGPTLPSHIQIIGGSTVGAHTLAQYVPNLERLLVFRLLEQLTTVYSTVTIANFQTLIGGLRMSFFDVEKLAVKAMRLRQLAVRIDHRAGIIRLGSEAQETAAMRKQLTALAARLQSVAESIAPQPTEGTIVPVDRREQVFHFARIHSETHRREMARRKAQVAVRREAAERAIMQQQMMEHNAKLAMEAAAKKQEQERLEAEEQARKEAELKKIEEKLEKEKIAALLQQAGEKQVDLEKLAAKHLDQAALQRAVQEKLLKAKEEETRRRAEQARKVDYLVRALREAESTKVQALLQATLASEKAYVEEYNTSNLDKKRSTFETAMAVKGKITRMVPAAEAFEERIMKRRREQYLQKKKEREENEKLLFLRQKLENAKRRKGEEDARKVAEAARQKQATEEEKRRAEDEEKNAKIQARLDAAHEEAAAATAAVIGRADAASNWRQSGAGAASGGSSGGWGSRGAASSAAAGGSGKVVDGIKFGGAPPQFATSSNWRDREAAKSGSPSTPSPAAAPDAPARGGAFGAAGGSSGGYRPPAARGGAEGGGSRWR